MGHNILDVERQERRGRRLTSLATLTIVAVLAASWVGLFAFLSMSAAYGTFSDLETRYLPDPESQDLTLPNLSQISRVYTENGEVLAELHAGKNSEPVALETVPEQVQQAVLAAEDADFFEHEGVDFQSIMRAAVNNIQGGRRQGGSTITQQVIKQHFVGGEQTIERKIAEAVLAAEMERRYSKEQILEFYLNSVYFGWGAYGVHTAAHEYFGKTLEELTLGEAATLATLIRNPALYDPREWPERAADRRDDVLEVMVANGFITESQALRAQREPLTTVPHPEFQGPADHVVAEAKRQLLHDPQFAFLGATYEERKRAVFGCDPADTACQGGGGLKVFVSIDLGLQQEANRILSEWLPQPEDPEAQAPTGAIAMVDNATGAVRVMASGLTFDEEQFDLALQGARQAGSAFKPFALVAALESGITLGSFWDSTSPQKIECGFPCAPNGSSIWTVRNATDSTVGGGLISLLSATIGSVNAVYAQVSVEVGPAKIVEVAHRMGITSELPEVYSLTLGTGSTSPLDMASAFSNFATNGLHARPHVISRIENAAGETIYTHQAAPQQVIDPRIASASRRALEQAVAQGTGTRAKIGRPQFGKTGTHQNFRDAWFVGGVPQYTTAVWVGFPDAQIPLQNLVINGERYSRVFGGSVPAPIWRQFMETALASVPVADFPPPAEGVEALFRVPTTEVPSVVGLFVGEARREILNAHLKPAVQEVNSLAPKGTVLGQSPSPGAVVQQGSGVSLSVSSGLPPEAPVPNLLGTPEGQVDPAVQAFADSTGLSVSYSLTYSPTNDPNLVGKVTAVSPAPGTMIQDGAHLTITIGTQPPPPPPEEEEKGPEPPVVPAPPPGG